MVLVGTSDGGGWMWRVPSGDCKTFQGQSCRNTCAALMSDGQFLELALNLSKIGHINCVKLLSQENEPALAMRMGV